MRDIPSKFQQRLAGLWNAFNRSGYWMARWLLARWVKLHIVPDQPAALGLTPDQPLMYVLETRSLSNLLVVEQACRERHLPRPLAPFSAFAAPLPRSVFAIKRWRGLLVRKPDPRYSQTLLALIEAARAQPAFDVQLAPVTVTWGRAPDQERGWFKLLLAESWDKVGKLRKFFIILAHGRNTWVQFSSPLSLRQALADGLDQERGARKLARILRVHFRQVRAAMIGPELIGRDTLIDRLLRDPLVVEAIAEESQTHAISTGKATQRARRHAYEIAANFSYPFALLARRSLRRLWDRLYDGVEFSHIDSVHRLAPDHTLVYLPCHRSHIDYLLLSYSLHAHGLAIPHIAAGVNLNIPFIGPLLRRGGAFYLRRSFKGERLYSAVFRAYFNSLLALGTPLEFFIEGGRSRTGRSLAPKPGLLDMTLRSVTANAGRPLALLPISIGYEKLVEAQSYLAELGGAPKQKESLKGLLKSLKTLRSRFGRVYVNIGEPLLLEGFLDQHQPGWRDQDLAPGQRPPWLADAVGALGWEVMTRINAAAAVNPVNLLALALLATPKLAMGEEELAELLDVYRALLRIAPYSARHTVSPLSGRAMIAHGITLGTVRRRDHPLGSIIYVNEADAARLSYFQNNIVHLFALAGFIACCFQNTHSLARARIFELGKRLYPFLRAELFLPWQTDEIETALVRQLDALVAVGLIERDGDRFSRPWAHSRRALHLGVLARGLVHTFERYYIAVTLLLRAGPHTIDAGRLQELCHWMAQRLALLYVFRAPEFFDPGLFQRFQQTLRELGLLWSDERGLLVFDGALGRGYRDARVLLSAPVRQGIRQAARGGDAILRVAGSVTAPNSPPRATEGGGAP